MHDSIFTCDTYVTDLPLFTCIWEIIGENHIYLAAFEASESMSRYGSVELKTNFLVPRCQGAASCVTVVLPASSLRGSHAHAAHASMHGIFHFEK